MSWVSSLGSLVGSGGNILDTTGWMGFSSAKSLSKRTLAQQVAAEERLARELPSAQVEGLRAANLNPILAISNGLSTPSVGNGSITSPGHSDINPVEDYLHLKNVAAQNELLKAQKDSVDASTVKQYIDALNHIDTQGIGGVAGLAQSYLSNFAPSTVQQGLTRTILQNLQNKFNVSSSHSAKFLEPKADNSSNSAKARARKDDDEDMSVILENGDSYHFRKGENDPYKILKGSRFLRDGR